MSPSNNSQNPINTGKNASATTSVFVNGQTVPFEGGSVVDLLGNLKINTRAIAVELNQEIIPADQHASTHVNPGDRLEVVTLVGGG